MTPLHVAVENGQVASVQMLLSLGANCHVQDSVEGMTPLHLAVMIDRAEALDCAQLLLKSGAEVNAARFVSFYMNEKIADTIFELTFRMVKLRYIWLCICDAWRW